MTFIKVRYDIVKCHQLTHVNLLNRKMKMKEKMNKLHDRLVKCTINHKKPEDLLTSTLYNNTLLLILNYLIKEIEPTEEEIEVTEYLIKEWEGNLSKRPG